MFALSLLLYFLGNIKTMYYEALWNVLNKLKSYLKTYLIYCHRSVMPNSYCKKKYRFYYLSLSDSFFCSFLSLKDRLKKITVEKETLESHIKNEKDEKELYKVICCHY